MHIAVESRTAARASESTVGQKPRLINDSRLRDNVTIVHDQLDLNPI